MKVGFRKDWAAGTFSMSEYATLLGHIKTYVQNAGFNILAQSENSVDFIRGDAQLGAADDDIPHWAIKFGPVQYGPPGDLLQYYAVYGDPLGGVNTLWSMQYSGYYGGGNSAISAWFAADGREGWWWLYIAAMSGSSVSYAFDFFAGVRSRRYPADMSQGVCPRYMLIDSGNNLAIPYLIDADSGSQISMARGKAFSVFSNTKGYRHNGSSIPNIVVPIFPVPGDESPTNYSSALLGELIDIFAVTKGRQHLEEVMPGWKVLKMDFSADVVVPAPATFDVL